MIRRFFVAIAGVGLLAFVHLGGIGGCGSSGAAAGGAAATPAAAAASQGALSGVNTGIGSALNVVVGGALPALKLRPSALKLKSTESSDDSEDVSCTENEDGTVDCEDENSTTDGGSLSCSFDDSATEVECGDAGFDYTFDEGFTMTFEDYSAGDSCGQEVILNGTVTGHLGGTFSDCTGAFSLTATVQTTDLTVTLEDGTTQTVTFDLTYTYDDTTDTVSGEVCVDGECSTIDSFDDLDTTECTEAETEAEVDDCVDQCVIDICSSDDVADTSCEDSCQTSCDDTSSEEAGNCNSGSDNATMQLFDSICSQVTSCHDDITCDDCRTGLLATTQLDDNFGVPVDENSLTGQEVADGVDAETFVADEAALEQCLSDLGDLTCSDVNAGFDDSDPSNFENIENFIPEDISSCEGVFASS